MFIGILTLIALFLGYKFYAPRLEKNWGVDIHHLVPKRTLGLKPLNRRLAQLAQLGVILSINMLWGAIMGVVYGPLQMLWIVLGTLFFGAVINYYGGMYALTHDGHTLNYILKEKHPRLHLTFGLLLILIMMFGVAGTLSIMYHVDYLVQNHSPIIYLYFGGMLFLSLCSHRKFRIFYMLFALIVLAVSFYFVMYTAGEFQFASLSLDLSQYPELKFSYPLMFFVLAAGVMSGVDGFKCVLLTPSIKNEKTAKGIYVGAVVAQSVLMVLWAMILLAWNPEFAWLNKAMQRVTNPYELIQTRILSHFNTVSAFVMYATACILCIGGGGTMLRLTGVFAKELDVDKDVARDFVPLGCGLLAFGLYFLSALKFENSDILMMIANGAIRFVSTGVNCFDLLNMLMAGYVLGLLIIYLREKKKRYMPYVYACFVIGGLCLAYVISLIIGWPFWLGTVAGLTVTLLSVGGWYFYPRWKERRQG